LKIFQTNASGAAARAFALEDKAPLLLGVSTKNFVRAKSRLRKPERLQNGNSRSFKREVNGSNFLLSGLVGVLGLALVFAGVNAAFSGQDKVMKTSGSGAMNTIAGTRSMSGIVKAPKEFKAAKGYAKNLDKNLVHMVSIGDGLWTSN
jgi:hypothetical protein